jgi:acetyl esterase/lipase
MSAQAQDILELAPLKADTREAYGTAPQQYGDLYMPAGRGPHPVIVFIHGGFWRARYDLGHASHLCNALRNEGYAVWSIEYRRLGDPGGGYPGTIDDAVAAVRFVEQMAARHSLDTKRVVVMGHSAGGHLAAVAASRVSWLAGAIPMAGVLDLRRGWAMKLSGGVVEELMGGSPDSHSERYKPASPVEMPAPAGRVILLHGDADNIVPIELSERYAKAIPAADLRRFATVGHFEWIDPRTPQFNEIKRALRSVFEPAR